MEEGRERKEEGRMREGMREGRKREERGRRERDEGREEGGRWKVREEEGGESWIYRNPPPVTS
jgi:hypothetical protein